jgi:hypothetical protein
MKSLTAPRSAHDTARRRHGEARRHLHNFVERVVGHPVTDEELVPVLEDVARQLGMPPRQLDASIWEFQRGGPASV